MSAVTESFLRTPGSAPSGSGRKSFPNRPQSGSSSIGPLIGHKRTRNDWNVDRALFNPSATTRVVSHYSNPSLNYKVFAQAFSEQWQTGYKPYMPMFIHLNDKQTNRLRVLASLQLINYYLALASTDRTYLKMYLGRKKMKKSLIPGAELSDNEFEDLSHVGFIREFMKKWSFFGVVNNDMDIRSKLQKLFNCTVRGRGRVFNLWEVKHIQQGSRLFLNLELVDLDANLHFVAPDGTRMPSFPPSRKWEDTNRISRIWQLVPYTYRELVLKQDSVDPVAVAGNFYVGCVINAVAAKPDDYYQKRGCRDHHQMVQLPSIEIALHTLA